MHEDRTGEEMETPSGARPTVPSSDAVRGRFGYVDGLRGLAILGMLIYELHHHGVILAKGLVGHLIDEGSRGLDLFFVISGFALAYPVLVVLRSDGRVGFDLGRFAVRRLARLLPAAWVAIAALALAPAIAAVIVHPTLAAFEGALPPLGAILRECALLQVPPAAPDAFWVLAVAVRLSILFPLLLLVWSRSQRIFIGVGVAVVIFGPLGHLYGFGIGELPAFMLGIVAADWRVRHFGFARWGLYLFVAAAIAGVALETIVSGPLFAAAPFPTDNLGWAAAAFFLIAGVGHAERAERALSVPSLASAGSASYAFGLAIEPAISGAFPIAQRLETLGSHALGRGVTGPAGRVGRALAPGTPGASLLEALFVVACVTLAGYLLYRLVDRAVFERDPRMRLADRLEPLFLRLYGLLHTTGVLVFGRLPDDLRFEASGNGSDFYAPPPRSDPSERTTLTRRTTSPADHENEMIAAKKRLAERTTSMLADAEYEANRARGIVTPAPSSPSSAYPSPQSALPFDLSAPVQGEVRDVWQKPRAPASSSPPPQAAPPMPPAAEVAAGPPSAEDPEHVAFEQSSSPQDPRRSVVVPFRVVPAPQRPDEAQTYSAIFEKPKGPIRFKIGGEKAPPASEATPDGEE